MVRWWSIEEYERYRAAKIALMLGIKKRKARRKARSRKCR